MTKDWRKLTTQGERLAWAREQKGFADATEAAAALNVPAPTYLGHENNSRGLARAGSRYAAFFGVSLDWLIDGRGEPKAARASSSNVPENFVRVPLLEWVAAGRLTNPSSQIPVEQVPLLAFADLGRGDFFALKVRGDSMDRVAPEDSTIVVNRADKRLITGKYYVFEVNGETTFKMWPGGEPLYLAPFSTNPSNKPIFPKRKRDISVIGRVVRAVVDL